MEFQWRRIRLLYWAPLRNKRTILHIHSKVLNHMTQNVNDAMHHASLFQQVIDVGRYNFRLRWSLWLYWFFPTIANRLTAVVVYRLNIMEERLGGNLRRAGSASMTTWYYTIALIYSALTLPHAGDFYDFMVYSIIHLLIKSGLKLWPPLTFSSAHSCMYIIEIPRMHVIVHEIGYY